MRACARALARFRANDIVSYLIRAKTNQNAFIFYWTNVLRRRRRWRPQRPCLIRTAHNFYGIVRDHTHGAPGRTSASKKNTETKLIGLRARVAISPLQLVFPHSSLALSFAVSLAHSPDTCWSLFDYVCRQIVLRSHEMTAARHSDGELPPYLRMSTCLHTQQQQQPPNTRYRRFHLYAS